MSEIVFKIEIANNEFRLTAWEPSPYRVVFTVSGQTQDFVRASFREWLRYGAEADYSTCTDTTEASLPANINKGTYDAGYDSP